MRPVECGRRCAYQIVPCESRPPTRSRKLLPLPLVAGRPVGGEFLQRVACALLLAESLDNNDDNNNKWPRAAGRTCPNRSIGQSRGRPEAGARPGLILICCCIACQVATSVKRVRPRSNVAFESFIYLPPSRPPCCISSILSSNNDHIGAATNNSFTWPFSPLLSSPRTNDHAEGQL